MKSFIWLIIIMTSMPVLAQIGGPKAAHPAQVQEQEKVDRDTKLEEAVKARKQKIDALIRPEVRAKLDLAARAVLSRLASDSENADPLAMVNQQVRRRFGRLSSRQSNLLSFFVLAKVSWLLSHPEQMKEKLGGTNNLSEVQSVKLQKMMDRRSKLMSTLSNILKKISDTQDSVLKNIK